ncbi:MAG: hypothetical protein R3B40_24725 [Polyangiales bacterium]
MLACPKCRTEIPASDVNIEALVGKCAGCNHVFRIDPSTLDEAGAVAPPSPARPTSITLTREEPSALFQDTYREATTRAPSAFTLTRRWFQPHHVFLLFFCIAWDSFLVFWYSSAFGSDASWLMVVFPVAHVAVGVGLTYSVLAGFLNRTTLTLTADTLSVRHGPVPWRGNARFARSDLRGAELSEQPRDRSSEATGSGSHAVSVRLADESLVKLMGGLTDQEVRFVQWTVTDALRP